MSAAKKPLPRPPDLLPKAAYDPVSFMWYLPLWDALEYLDEVRVHGGGQRAGPKVYFLWTYHQLLVSIEGCPVLSHEALQWGMQVGLKLKGPCLVPGSP